MLNQGNCSNATTCCNSIGVWIGSRSRIEGSGRWWGVSVVGWVAITLLMLRSWWFIYIRRLSLLERVWGGRKDRGGKNVLASALVMVHLQEMTDMFLTTTTTTTTTTTQQQQQQQPQYVCQKLLHMRSASWMSSQSTNDSTMLTSNERKYWLDPFNGFGNPNPQMAIETNKHFRFTNSASPFCNLLAVVHHIFLIEGC